MKVVKTFPPFVYCTKPRDTTQQVYQLNLDVVKRIRTNVESDTVGYRNPPGTFWNDIPTGLHYAPDAGEWTQRIGKRLIRSTAFGVASGGSFAMLFSPGLNSQQQGTYITLGTAFGIVSLAELFGAEAALIEKGRCMSRQKQSTFLFTPRGLYWCYRF